MHQDHVVPRTLRRFVSRVVPRQLLGTVPACPTCNWRKMARRLVPPTWAHLLPLLEEYFPGQTPWRVWTGGVDEPAYAEAWR